MGAPVRPHRPHMPKSASADGQTEFLSLYRDCIPCSAVKTRIILMTLSNVQGHLNLVKVIARKEKI